MKKHVFIISAVILLAFSAGITAAAGLSDTGQTKCYNDTAEMLTGCPAAETDAFYGQDAQYNFIPQSFTKLNEDGSIWAEGDPTPHAMVRDNVTGLVWEVKTLENSTEKPNWNDAKTYCETLPLGGYSDWRLPTREELRSIADYGRSAPFLNPEYFPNAQTSYWSSEIFAITTSKAWYFMYNTGSSNTSFRVNTAAHVMAVRCGHSDKPLFVDNGDQTVTDMRTGLMWQQRDTTNAVLLTWEEALAYCESLSWASYDDWRLPSVKELASFLDLSSSPTVNQNFFPNIFSDLYWTSTTLPQTPANAYAFSFSNGTDSLYTIKYDTMKKQMTGSAASAYVIAVRGGNPGSFPVKGDLNGDGSADLADAIAALQICADAGATVTSPFDLTKISAAGTSQIGMPEAIYVLQAVAGFERCGL